MQPEEYVRRVWVNFPAETVFGWHERPGAFERLNPPWERVEVVDRTGGIRDGDRMMLKVPFGPLRFRWEVEHRDYEAGRQFCDEQVNGPFPYWKHTHRVVPEGPGKCYLEDRVEYVLPFAMRMVGKSVFRKQLDRMFTYRHRLMAQDLALHDRFGDRGPLKVLISGSTGLVGSALAVFLSTGGHEVRRLVRTKPEAGSGDVHWDPAKDILRMGDLEGFDAVVHLAGENIGQGRWTEDKKRRIRESRVKGTQLLCDALACLKRPPKVLVSASAIGYYGSRGDEVLTEESSHGTDFLADVCRDWEAVTEVVEKNRVRVVNLRFGVVLSPGGGALSRMLFPFKMGGGGPIGDGTQYMSWISLEDVVQVIHHVIRREDLAGPVNAVAPGAVRNAEFGKTLGRVLRRPAVLPMPAFVVQKAFGEMGEALLLSSARVEPVKLKGSGFQFLHSDLEKGLRYLLGR